MKGVDSLEKKLKKFMKKAQNQTLNVGFINGKSYPDTGISVAQVAFDNEFGTTENPTRPFFRTMIAKESSTWGKKLTGAIQHTHYDLDQSMGLLGENIVGALTQSIRDWQTPPNSAKTIARKGFNKPLIDTGLMSSSITKEVKNGYSRDS